MPYPPFIIPVFLPHSGCPHRCVFCNQRRITGIESEPPSPQQIAAHITRFLTYKGAKRGKTQISFYGGNFLGLASDLVEQYLNECESFVEHGDIGGVRFSTRPDTIDGKRMALITPFSVQTVEIGVQSMNDRVLRASGRGHTADDAEAAVRFVKSEGYETGVQLMTGLPGDDESSLFATATRIIGLAPDFVRIYPALVFENSPLADMFRKGRYEPTPLHRCVAQVKKLYQMFTQNDVPVIRMGLQASDGFDDPSSLIAGPYHPAFGHLVKSAVILDKATAAIDSHSSVGGVLIIHVNPRTISIMRGIGNENIKTLQVRFGFSGIRVFPDHSLSEGDIRINME